jgi:hypothetical protein
MMLLIRLLQILVFLLVVRMLLRGVATFFGALQAPARPAQPRAEPGCPTELVRDRVCNTFLPRDRALVARVAGQEQHFCSSACRDKALALERAS